MAENQPTHTEEWRPVPGHEGSYEVSNHGRVRSLDRTIKTKAGVRKHRKGQMLTHMPNNMGYSRVGISDKKVLVHHLVLDAFVGPRKPGQECRHLDGNPKNNQLSNLAWGTHSENINDKVTHGTDHQRRKTHCPRGHKLEEPNLGRSMMKRGSRNCRACAHARSYAWTRGIPTGSSEFNHLADQKYNTIMSA